MNNANSRHELSTGFIVTVAIIVEGGLAILALLWWWIAAREPSWNVSLANAGIGLALTLPLLAINAVIFGPWGEKFSFFSPCREFKSEVVVPLVQFFHIPSACIVSLLAGVGEEMLFRGVILEEAGLFISSVLFALLHFGPAVRRYCIVACLYTVFGYYLGMVYVLTESLFAVALCHAAYDFVAIIVLKWESARTTCS